jgi:hypothetical protein
MIADCQFSIADLAYLPIGDAKNRQLAIGNWQ